MDQADYDGRTALHLACSKGQLDTVRLLVDRGASVNAPDRFHNTPLHNAIHFKSVVTASLSVPLSLSLSVCSLDYNYNDIFISEESNIMVIRFLL